MTAATLSQYGHVERKLGRPAEAIPHLERAAAFYLEQVPLAALAHTAVAYAAATYARAGGGGGGGGV